MMFFVKAQTAGPAGRRICGRLAAPVAGLFVMLLVLPFPAVADGYPVGVADTLSLKVMEWQPIDGLVRDWPAMQGDYAVGADGAISVPFLGRMAVVGQTTQQVSAAISEGLKQRFALSEAPDAQVEIAAYQPVFVSGMVRDAGEFPFRPSLTVGQAISMAGGPADEAGRNPFSVTAYLNAEVQLDLYRDADLGLRIRLARLTAERDGQADFAMPDGIEPSPRAEEIFASEQAIMRLRADRIERELRTMASRDTLLNNEIVALDQKTVLLQRQRDVAETALASVRELVGRGLAVQDRLSNAETRLGTLESQLLDLSTAILRARQSLVTSERDRLALIDSFAIEVAQEHLSTSSAIAENARRLETQVRILASEVIFAVPSDDGVSPADLAVVTITRREGANLVRLSASLDTALMPGDLIEVRPPQPPATP